MHASRRIAASTILALCLATLACHKQPAERSDASAPDAGRSDAAPPDAGPAPFQHFPDAALRFVPKSWRRRPLPLVGDWAAVSPDRKTIIVGREGRATLSPGQRPIGVKEIDSATFAPDGAHVALVTLQGTDATGISVLALPETKVVSSMSAAHFVRWLSASTLLVAKDGLLWRLSTTVGAVPERIGSATPLYSCLSWGSYRTGDSCARPEVLLSVSDDLTKAVVAQFAAGTGRDLVFNANTMVADVRRIDLREGSSRSLFPGRMIPCIQNNQPRPCNSNYVAASDDATLVCVRSEQHLAEGRYPIECVRGDAAPEEVVSFDHRPLHSTLSIAAEGKLLRFVGNEDDAIGVVDFEARGWWVVRGPANWRNARIDLASRTWWNLPDGPNGSEGWIIGMHGNGDAIVVGHKVGQSSRLEVLEQE